MIYTKRVKGTKDHYRTSQFALSLIISFFILLSFDTVGQTTLSGTVLFDGLGLEGATVAVFKDGEASGDFTYTDKSGKYTLKTFEEIPFDVRVDFLGYKSATVTMGDRMSPVINFDLEEKDIMLDQVVVGASRFEEDLMTTPVTVYKLDSRELRQFGNESYYASIQNMKGVQAMASSLSLPSYNTRGFSDPANFRFKQYIDGIDMTNPIGLSIANSVGASDLDIQSIELVPGASSALYGSDAFNGMLRMYTKNPFETPGFSFLSKTGVTSQEAAGTNFFGELNMRFAHKLSEKVAIKLDFHSRKAYDWIGADRSHRIPSNLYEERDAFLALDVDDPEGYLRFDAVHRVGDEYGNGIGVISEGFTLTGPDGETMEIAPRTMARTGIWEKDLVDNELNDYRLNVGIHYRPGKDWELVYSYKHSFSDWLIRSSVTFPQYDYLQRIHYGQVKNSWMDVRAYYHKLDNYRSSWSAPNAADAIQRALQPDDDWVADLQDNYSITGNLKSAREYADRFMPGGSEFNQNDYDAAFNATINNTDFAGTNSSFITGSQAVDFSSYVNADADFDLSKFLGGFNLLAGVNFRSYHINSGGSFYNDGPLGFGEPVNVNQFGAYTQATDNFIDNRLRVTAALRYDWHQDYKSSFSPRLATSFAIGAKRNHHLRAAFQTGFRNPSIQEGFFRLQLTGAFVVVGAAQRSIDNFIYEGRTGDRFTLQEIIDADGRGFTAVQPERNTTIEFGYKALFGDRLMVDVNYYHTWYQDFINRPTIVFMPGTPNFQLFAIRQNRSETVTSQGAGLEARYRLLKGVYVNATYDWADFDSPDFEPTNPDDAEAEKNAFLRSLQFNTPDQRVYAGISGESLGKSRRWGFQLGTHYTSSFIFHSNFGANDVDAINFFDGSVSYRVPEWNTTFKLGGSNIFGQEYNSIYGGPQIGSIYYLAIRYDQF